MQWSDDRNMGFSEAPAEKLYLPVETDEAAPSVAKQEADPGSLLNYVRKLIALRQSHEALGNYAPFEVFTAEEGSRLFAYKRGDYLLAVNPGTEVLKLETDGAYEPVFAVGTPTLEESKLTMPSQSFVVLKPLA